MTVKEYLSRYYYMKDEIKRIKAEVAEYKRLASSIPGCSFKQLRVDGTKKKEAPFVEWIYKAIEKEEKMNEMVKNLPFVKAEIISTIDQLDDSNLKRVLIYRYIDWLSWSELATKMYCATATVRRWHDKAILKISVQI